MGDVWTPLDPTLADRSDLGEKARRLCIVQRAGLRIPDSFVWTDHLDDASGAARALLTLDSSVERWMLRSSSPWEDRPGASAAGLFRSVSCLATPEELAAGLRAVVDSAEGVAATILGEVPTVTVLAQPHLTLQGWWTVELGRGEARVEGWGDPPKTLVDFTRGSARACDLTDALAEVGVDSGGLVVLQVRPAPSARPLPVSASSFEPRPAPDGKEWRWDRAHCPDPLSPLLASVFTEWLRDRTSRSQVYEGRWFDRIDSVGTVTEAEVAAELDAWDTTVAPALRQQLIRLEAMVTGLAPDPATWPRFVDTWLGFQADYFAAAAGPSRRWAMERTDRPDLSTTVAAQRTAALANLTELIRRDRPTLPLATWWPRASSRVRERWDQFLASHGHVAIRPWDGRGAPWSEDPRPLWQEIERRLELPPADLQPRVLMPPTDLATRVLVRCEDDDDLLAKAYALFRGAARTVTPSVYRDDAMDLVAADLRELLGTEPGSAWEAAVRRGRALAARWIAWCPTESDSSPRVRGIGAAAGRAEGPVRRLPSAQADGGPRRGDVLVVPTVHPQDAVVFDRVAGIVCEAGDALGHAAILAREFGIPLVVDAIDARRRLQGVERVIVDGTLGHVDPVERD